MYHTVALYFAQHLLVQCPAVQELSGAAGSTMIVMLLHRCQDRLTGSEMPATAFSKVTHLELSSLSVSLQQAVELSRQNLIMLDMSHATDLRVAANFGQEPRVKDLKHLYLSNCSLQELPESLGELKSLKTLDVASNSLSQLPRLLPSTLEGLYVSDNQLTQLPLTLQSMSSLRSLDVTNNHDLRSLPPLLGTNAQIDTVLASCCNLVNGLPESLFDSTTEKKKLRLLSLRSSNLRQLPVNLGSAVSLTGYLSLGHNQLTSLPPSIGHANKLMGLSLDNNRDLKVLPQSLANLTRLSTFDCKFCSSLQQCNGCLPKSLRFLVATGSADFDVIDAMSGTLTKLFTLDASFTATTLRQRLPDKFVLMQSLKKVTLNGCGGGPRLTELPLRWDRLTNLRELSFEVCLCVSFGLMLCMSAVIVTHLHQVRFHTPTSLFFSRRGMIFGYFLNLNQT